MISDHTPDKDRIKKSQYNKTYRAKNREKLLASDALRYELNGEQMRADARERDHAKREADPEGERLKVRVRYAANPEPTLIRCREAGAARRAALAGSETNDFTDAQFEEIQVVQKHCCYYCGVYCKGKMTRDHITPVTKGGQHTLHNIIAVCDACNKKKHTGPPPVPVQPMLLTLASAKKRKLGRHHKSDPQLPMDL